MFCSQVFLQIDCVQPRLSQLYFSPHKVSSRTDKAFKIDMNGRKITLSINRPAYIFSECSLLKKGNILNSEEVHHAQFANKLFTIKTVTRSGRYVQTLGHLYNLLIII